MTWTYDGAPGTTSAATRRDAVRLSLGDTDTNDQQLTDEEIAYFLANTTNDVLGAAIQGCRALIARFSRQVDNTHSGLSTSASQRSEHYRSLLEDLEEQAATSGGLVPYAGGLSSSEKTSMADDDDAVQPVFEVGQDDNPGTAPSSVNSSS